MVYSDYIGAASEVHPVELMDPNDNSKPMLTIDPRYTWGTWVAGEWNNLSGLVSALTGKNYNYPSMAKTIPYEYAEARLLRPVGKLFPDS